jgi:hypothetical protein
MVLSAGTRLGSYESPAADGQRFLVNLRANLSSGTLNVMTNWEKAAARSGAK